MFDVLDEYLKGYIFKYDPTYKEHFNNAVLPNIPKHLMSECYFKNTETHVFKRCRCTVRLMTIQNITSIECEFTCCLDHLYYGVERVLSDILIDTVIISMTEIFEAIENLKKRIRETRIYEDVNLDFLLYLDFPETRQLQFIVYIQRSVLTVRFNSYKLCYDDESFDSRRTLYLLENTVRTGESEYFYPVVVS